MAAATASVAHIRAGRINWRLFAWMVGPSMVGALAGGYVSGKLPGDALLGVIAAVLLISGADLLRGRRPPPARGDADLDIRAAVLSGAFIGLLGGIVRLILGSLRMPALLRLVGRSPPGRWAPTWRWGSGWDWPASRAICPPPDPTGGCSGWGPPPRSRERSWALGLTGRLSDAQLLRAIGAVLLVAGAACAAQAAT